MKKICILNQKGGSGKTTTAVNLGAALARMDKWVQLVDMDPQGHLTQSLGLGSPELNLYHLLKGEANLRDLITARGELSLIPAGLDLAGIESELAAVPGREFILKESLKNVRGFGFCFIDCPPSLGLLSVMALNAAQGVIIPLQVEFLALQSLTRLLKTVDLVKQRLNPKLEIIGILATRFDGRKRLNREIVEKSRAFFKGKMYKTVIRENISLAEAPSYGQTIFEYRMNSHGAADYMNLAQEFLKKEGVS